MEPLDASTQVLERRAQALVKESSDMAALALDRQVEAERLAAALTVKLQEQQEWQLKVDSIDAGDLPRYIEASGLLSLPALFCSVFCSGCYRTTSRWAG
ncbi:hypothetical protein COHA_008949 [Chlorella ohadii]|uniref:Uncharacterized protein n=1 Tax=Chlorella ohadii TaxID=2649997 RepID=A0AAD5DIZ5_9CHLO|nr:hypothetical protein COHA_008949 [Chlorella ohadii]